MQKVVTSDAVGAAVVGRKASKSYGGNSCAGVRAGMVLMAGATVVGGQKNGFKKKGVGAGVGFILLLVTLLLDGDSEFTSELAFVLALLVVRLRSSNCCCCCSSIARALSTRRRAAHRKSCWIARARRIVVVVVAVMMMMMMMYIDRLINQ